MCNQAERRELLIHKLRVKVKSLADEAKIIRQEMRKVQIGWVKESLYLHRIGIVRTEARHSQLALSAVRGRPYQHAERKCKSPPDWKKIQDMVKRLNYSWFLDVGIEDWVKMGKDWADR